MSNKTYHSGKLRSITVKKEEYLLCRNDNNILHIYSIGTSK